MVHLVLPDGIEKATYTLHSAQGKVSENGEITDRQATLHFLKLTSGVYFLTVHYGEVVPPIRGVGRFLIFYDQAIPLDRRDRQ